MSCQYLERGSVSIREGNPDQSCLERGGSLAYFPHLIHPPGLNIPGVGRAKETGGGTAITVHLFFHSFFSEGEIRDAKQGMQKRKKKKGERGKKHTRKHGRAASGFSFTTSCIIDRSMFKEREKKERKKGGEKNTKKKNT